MADEEKPKSRISIDPDRSGQPSYPLEKMTQGRQSRWKRAQAEEVHKKSGRVPPQATDVEMSVLGAMLIEREAIPKAIEILPPEAFYSSKHQKIYMAILSLFERGNPVDLVTLTDELKRRDELEDIGGPYYLTELTTQVASAANVEYHARIIAEKSLLRKLIETMTGLVGEAYDSSADAFELLDKAESEIFRISDNQLRKAASSINDVVKDTLERLEKIHGREGGITGVPSGFHRLDRLTSGWQKSDLIIIAARPSMGKCVTADTKIVHPEGSVSTIGEIHERRDGELFTLQDDWTFGTTRPSAFVDDGVKPTFKITTRLGRTIETTLSHPFRTLEGWKPLAELNEGDHIAVPRKLEAFGSDTMPEHRVKLLAYLIGDGCLCGTCPEFTNSNPVLRDEFERCVEAFGGANVELDERAQPQQSASAPSTSCYGHPPASLRSAFPLRRGKGRVATKGDVDTSTLGRLHHRFPERTLAPEGHASISRRSPNPLTLWLRQLGLWGCDASTKTIPDCIFTLHRPLVALFLNRLFATDGGATVLKSGQSQIGYATASETLARQVQHLLLRFGIIAKLKKRRIPYQDQQRTGWQLDITDARSLQTFVDDIGLFGKEEALEQIETALSRRRYQTNRDLIPIDLIPIEVWEQLSTAKGDEPWAALARRATIKGTSNIHVGRRAPTRRRLCKLAHALNDASRCHLADSEVYWDEIVSIESTGRKQVYDLTIPETHNFVANDVCVHNTSFALGCALNAAMHPTHSTGVAVFSLEMGAQQLAQRLLTSEARVNAQAARTGRMNDEDWQRLARAAGKLSEAEIYIDDTPGLSVLELRAKCRRLKAEHDIGLVVVDYLQLMQASNASRHNNREQEIAHISRSLKGLAKELNLPVIALSQLNRGVENRGGDKRPQLSDLRESGSIEQDADVVAFIYRAERYGITVDENGNSTEGMAEIIIGKQRNGPVGTVELAFVSQYARFENLTTRYEESSAGGSGNMGSGDMGASSGDGFNAPQPPIDDAPF